MHPFIEKHLFNSNAKITSQFTAFFVVGAVYWLMLQFGLLLVVQPEGIASIWPVSGFALAVLLLSPKQMRAKYVSLFFITNIIGNIYGGNSFLVSLGFALANSFESIMGVAILNYICKSKITFERTIEIFALFVVAIFGNAITALLGASVSFFAFDAPFLKTWELWWAADGLGIILVTPFIVTWITKRDNGKTATWNHLLESTIFTFLLLAFSWLLFGPFTVAEKPMLRTFMIFPILIWLAFRFSIREMASALLIVAIIANWNTILGFGTFAFLDQNVNQHLVSIQTFLTVMVFSGLFLSALILDRKKKEELLREGESSLKRAQEIAKLGSWDLDLTTHKVTWSENCYSLYGLKLFEIEPSFDYFKSRVHPDDLHIIEEVFESLIKTKLPINSVTRMIFPGGSIKWFQHNIVPIIKNDTVVAIKGINIDITERQQSADALRLSEERFRAIWNESFDGMRLIDKNGTIVMANSAFCNQIGKSIDELEDHSLDVMYDPMIGKSILSATVNNFHKNAVVPHFERELTLWNNRKVWFELSNSFIKLGTGQNYLLSIFRDITERKRVEKTLEENQRFLSDIIENNGAVIYVKDRDGRYELVNKKYEETTGLHRDMLIGKTDIEMFPGEIGKKFRKHDIEVMELGVVTENEEELENARGKSYFLSTKFPLWDNNNAVKGICGISTDITQRKHGEDNLKKSESKYRTLIENTGIGYLIIDKNGRVIDANKEYVRLSGHKELHEILGKTVLEWTAEYEKAKNAEAVTQCGKDGFIRNLVIDYVDGGGQITPVEISATIEGKGEESRILTICRDITQRKQAAEALQKSETHFRTLFEKATDGIMFISFDSKITMVNESFAKMHGYTVDEMQKMSLKDLDTPETSRRVSERISQLMLGETLVFEVEHYHKDGHTIQLEVSANLFISGNEKIIQSFHRDITERKVLQNQLLQSQKLESIGTLSAGIAHDFNNILNVIVGNSDLLTKSSLDEKNARRIDAIVRSANRGMNLIKQLMLFARKTKENYIPLFINDIVEDIAKLISETFPKTITVSLELDKNLPKITADPNHMHQVLMNLSVNARDAMPSGGTLTYCASLQSGEILRHSFPEVSTERYIMLTVKDTGMGMGEETLRKIFDPFYTTKEVGKGTGLGMSVVQGIIKSHNGFIEVRSKVNIGTEIEMYLPVLDSEESKVVSEISETTLNLTGNETILLIEDEEFSHDVMEDLLHSLGYQIIHARDGEEGVELYKNKKDQINIVVSDFGLPKFNGEEVFRRIKEINPEVPFILISGYLEPEISDRLSKLGVTTIVAKPFKPAGLLSRIRETLDDKR